MKLTKTLSAIALALLSYNALASDNEHDEGEKLYKAQCAACHGATGGMDMSKRIAPPIAGVRMHYIGAHPEKDAFVAAVSGWLANQDESKSLMPGAIQQFKLMPPLTVAQEDAEKIAAYIYAGEIEKPEGFDKHVEEMHGKMGMGQGMHGMGKGMHGKGMPGKGMPGMMHGMKPGMKHGMKPGMKHGMGQGMHGKGMHGKGMHGKGMHGKGMPGMGRGPGMMPGDMRARMMQQFGLSAEQMQKMQVLMKQKSATMQSLRQQKQALNKKFHGLDTGSANYKSEIFSLAEEQATLARRMAIEKGEMRFNMESLLNPEQRQKFAQMRAQKRAMKQRMGQGKGMGHRMGMPNMGMHSGRMPQMRKHPRGMPQMGMPPFSMPKMEKPPVSAPTTTAPKAPDAPTAAAPTMGAPAATTEAPTTETAPKSE